LKESQQLGSRKWKNIFKLISNILKLFPLVSLIIIPLVDVSSADDNRVEFYLLKMRYFVDVEFMRYFPTAISKSEVETIY